MSEEAAVTGTGRVCGASASSAPSSTAVSTPSSSMIPTMSWQKDRQRMFGSMPWISTTSRSEPGSLASDIRVVGQLMRRVLPSTSSTVGRVTWKS